jgi:hypothetical protein
LKPATWIHLINKFPLRAKVDEDPDGLNVSFTVALFIMFAPPLLIFIISNATITLTARFTGRGSAFRYVALILLAAETYSYQYATANTYDTRGWAGRVPGGACSWAIITAFDRLILRGWDYDNYMQRTLAFKRKRNPSIEGASSESAAKTRMDFASEVTGDARGIDTFWEVKNVPPFSITDPKFVPTRGNFLAKHLIIVVITYHAHNWAIKQMCTLNRGLLDAAYVPLLSRLQDVTYNEIQTRITATFAYWLAQCAFLQCFYSVACIFTAVSTPQDIRPFRPLFGSPSDAYSIRNAWGYITSIYTYHKIQANDLQEVMASNTSLRPGGNI